MHVAGVLGIQLAEVLERFDSDPALVRAALAGLAAKTPEALVSAAIPLLGYGTKGPAVEALVGVLLDQGLLAAALLDPSGCPLAQARTTVRLVVDVEPRFDLELLRAAMSRDPATVRGRTALMRALEIVTPLPDRTNLMPELTRLLVSSDARVRSKVVLLAGKHPEFQSQMVPFLKDPDGRIRANAFEALWGVDGESIRERLRDALDDNVPRVVGNALVGLHLLGEPGDAQRFDRTLARGPGFRATAAWAMGRIGEERYLPPLKLLLKSGDAAVRRAALRALVDIRKRVEEREPAPRQE